MEDNPILSLACSMYAKRGIYALLLGSGVSKTAGIPTGWEITNDLIKRIAGEDLSNPAEWYKNKFGKDPDYSEIVRKLGRTQAERSMLLRGYFEPIDDEENRGLKTPTKAHRSIARLIKSGYIKVIITTNFDRLLEQALFDEGVIPEVIANIDQIKGATPLALTDCVIVKVHGDYKDARIRNTENELAHYEPAMRKYLDRIFDEIGLIICGWSGDWDVALRGCLARCKNHRFSTYWLHVGEPSEEAEKIIKQRWAEKIRLKNADEFFCELEENIAALSDFSVRNQPISIEIAKLKLKRWIEKGQVIRIYDLLIDESKRIMAYCDAQPWDKVNGAILNDEFDINKYTKDIIELMKTLVATTAILCFWYKNNDQIDEFLLRTFNILTKDYTDFGARHFLTRYNAPYYYLPALFFFCTALISCVNSANYKTLFRIFDYNFGKRNNNWIFEIKQPISMYLYQISFSHKDGVTDVMRTLQSEYMADNNEFNYYRDKAIALWTMECWHRDETIPYNIELISYCKGLNELFKSELSLGQSSEILQAGFFNNNSTRFVEATKRVKVRKVF